MAKRVLVELIDDLDQSPADETLFFGIDGTNYQIDLNAEHAANLREALAKYVSAGTKVTNKRGRSTSSSTQLGPSAREIRDWARGQGIELSERGRIPADVREKFEAAH